MGARGIRDLHPRLRLGRHLDFIPDHSNLESVDLHPTIVAPSPISHIESPSVQRADHDAVFDMPGPQRSAGMRAEIVDRVISPLGMKHGNQPVIDFKGASRFLRDLAHFGDRYELTHADLAPSGGSSKRCCQLRTTVGSKPNRVRRQHRPASDSGRRLRWQPPSSMIAGKRPRASQKTADRLHSSNAKATASRGKPNLVANHLQAHPLWAAKVPITGVLKSWIAQVSGRQLCRNVYPAVAVTTNGHEGGWPEANIGRLHQVDRLGATCWSRGGGLHCGFSQRALLRRRSTEASGIVSGLPTGGNSDR